MKFNGRISCFLRTFAVVFISFLPRATGVAAGDENWDATFGVPGANGNAFSIAVAGRQVFFGGGFSRIGGIDAAHVAMWDRTNWFALGGGVNGAVFALAVSGQSLFVGGTFPGAGGISANSVAKWDGTNWSAVGSGIVGRVNVLAVMGGDIYAGGSFSRAGGLAVSNLAKWDGSAWNDVGGGVNGSVYTLAVKGNELYVGGAFNHAGPVAVTNVARWDGTTWSAVGDPASAPPSALMVAESGLWLYAARSTWLSEAGFRLERWDGTNWEDIAAGTFDFNCADCHAQTHQIIANGADVYITGNFSGIDGLSASGIARWDGTNWSSLGCGLAGEAYAVASSGDGIIVGGNFQQAGGLPSTRIALWHVPHPLSASRTGSSLTLAWPATGTNFMLETSQDLVQSSWNCVSQPWFILKDKCIVTNDISGERRFYRLRWR